MAALAALVATPALATTDPDTRIVRYLEKAEVHREAERFDRAYKALGKAYDLGGDACTPCVLAFVDTDLAAGDVDAALDSAGVLWPDEDEISLLRRLAMRTEGENWQVLTRLVLRLGEADDVDQLMEVIEAYLDSHDHRIRSSICGVAFVPGKAFAAKLNEELVAIDWRGPFLPGGAVSSARGLSHELPKPTARSFLNGTAGDVYLFAVVSPRGRPTTVRVARGLPDGLSNRAAETLWDWRFEPATRDGEPVSSCVSIVLRFPRRG